MIEVLTSGRRIHQRATACIGVRGGGTDVGTAGSERLLFIVYPLEYAPSWQFAPYALKFCCVYRKYLSDYQTINELVWCSMKRLNFRLGTKSLQPDHSQNRNSSQFLVSGRSLQTTSKRENLTAFHLPGEPIAPSPTECLLVPDFVDNKNGLLACRAQPTFFQQTQRGRKNRTIGMCLRLFNRARCS